MDGQEGLPWQWILEYLLDIKDIGLPILREIISLVPNIVVHGSLQKKIAVRYLEEAAISDNLDEHAIPLLIALLEDDHREEPLVSSKIKNLLLRMQVELADMWVQSSNHDNKSSEVLETYSITHLRHDLFQCITSKKAHFEQTFICQLLHDYFVGKYCHIEGSVGAQVLRKDDGGRDILSSEKNPVGSDDETVVGGWNSDADSEEAANSTEAHSAALLKDKGEKSCTVIDCLNMLNSGKNVMKHSYSLDAVDEANIYKGKNSAIDLPSALYPGQREEDAKILISQTNGEVQVNNDSRTDDQFMGPQDTAINQSVGVSHQEFCHMCRNPGMLLCCVGCPVAVHTSCLASILSVPEQHWYCPICSQKRAAEALMVAQEEEMVARERSTKFLATFDANKRLSDTHTVLSTMLDKDGKGRSSIDVKTYAAQVGLKMPSQQGVSPSEVAGDSIAAHVTNECCPKVTRNNDGRVLAKSAHKIDLTEQIAEDIDGGDAESSQRENMRLPKKPDGTNTTLEILEAKPCKEDHVLRIDNDLDGDLQTTDMNTAEAIVLDKDHFHKADGECHDSGLEGDGEERVRGRTRTDKKSSRRNHMPGMRRKRLRWSKEEEDTLKEGVKRFSRGNGEWGFQWTRILEFGQGRFHPGRTVVDLKDKWRNLARAS